MREIIDLQEGVPQLVPREALDDATARAIFYTDGLDLEFPSPKHDFKYRLLCANRAGQFPIGRNLLIRVAPKVPVRNVFAMLELAYNLKSLKLYDGLVAVDSVAGMYERLASILADRVLDRSRRGMHRSYVDIASDEIVVRGRIALGRTLVGLAGGRARIDCEYQEHTSDVEDNQILLCALDAACRIGLRRIEVAAKVRAARRALMGNVRQKQFDASACSGRAYDRLNQDYEPMHRICELILASVGPGFNQGGYAAIPFSVDMPRLFELYVAKWLAQRLPAHIQFQRQHSVRLDARGKIVYYMDAVLVDKATRRPLAVLDTKYKHEAATSDDVQQVIAYATELGASDAILIFPSVSVATIDLPPTSRRSVRVRSIAFDLAAELESSGSACMQAIAQLH